MTITCGFLEIYSHFLLYHFTEPLNLARNGARQLMAHSSAFSFSYDLPGSMGLCSPISLSRLASITFAEWGLGELMPSLLHHPRLVPRNVTKTAKDLTEAAQRILRAG